MNEEEGLGEIIKKQDEELLEEYKRQQNPQDPNVLEEELKKKQKNADDDDLEKKNLLGSRLLDAIEKPVGSALNYFMEKSRPDDSTYLDEVLQRAGGAVVGAGLGSYGGLKGSLIGAIAGGVAGFDRTTQALGNIPGVQQLGKAQDFVADVAGKPFEAVGVDPRFGGWAARIGTDFAFDRGIRTGIEGTRRTILNQHYIRTYTPSLDFEGSVGAAKARRGNPNWRPNLKTMGYFPDTRNAVSQFGQQQVDDLMEKARLHRVKRQADGKLELMKDHQGFLSMNRVDKDGQPFEEIAFVVKRKGNPNKLDPSSNDNYEVKTLSQVMQQMRVETKWMTNQASTEVQEMQMIRSALNKLGTDHPDVYLSKLMEYGGSAYLEHMIGKSQYDWLWNIKEANPTKYPWIEALERNDAKNLRLLVNKGYKKLKDTTEGRVVPINKKLLKEKRYKDMYIVNIEDPMNNPYSSTKILHRSNPGNLIIQMAKPGDKTPKTIGIMGDYLQDFYGPDFMRNYNGNKLLTIFKQMSPENKKIFSLYEPKVDKNFNVESATKYRDRVLTERIDLIIKEKGNFSYQDIQQEVFIDLLNFYELFAKKAQFVRRPEYITDVLRRAKSERRLSQAEPLPWSIKRFHQFHETKRSALRDLAGSIRDFETGMAPRMTKKDYNNLWKQIYEISTLDYNFTADVNDIADKLREITSKYE